jgi:hypothetical protein
MFSTKHALKITAADFTSTLIATYQYTRHHIPVDRNPETAVTSMSKVFFNYLNRTQYVTRTYKDTFRTAQ